MYVFALPMGVDVHFSVRLYLYGDQAATTAEREQPIWHSWMEERLKFGPGA